MLSGSLHQQMEAATELESSAIERLQRHFAFRDTVSAAQRRAEAKMRLELALGRYRGYRLNG